MAAQSKLRAQADDLLAKFTKIYLSKRPLVQRGLTVAFVLYVLSTTYRSLTARPAKPSSSKGKEKATDNAVDSSEARKPPRVAVSIITHILITEVSDRQPSSTLCFTNVSLPSSK